MLPTAKFGTIRIEPDSPVVAGSRGTWRVIYQVGARGMAVGGALRIRPPQRGMVRWELGMVTARASRPASTCRVQLFNCHPITYHWRQAPTIQVDLLGAPLADGDTITVTIGERGGYSRGYYRRARAQDHAVKGATWDFWVDAEGNKSLPPERPINDPWVSLESVAMDVLPGPPARLSVVARQSAPGDSRARVLIVARDRTGNFCDEYHGSAHIVGADQECDVEVSGGRAVAQLPLGQAAVTRYAAYDPAAELIGTSNPLASGFGGTGNHTLYFGDLHVMTGEGIIASALEGTAYAYRWGRDVGGLDFCVATNNLKCWDEDMVLDDEFDAPGEFVTIPAFEIGFPIGHKNVYFPTTRARKPDGSSPEALFASLKGQDALVVPHHTSVHSESSYQTFWTEHDFDTHDPEFERLIEITQDRGSMEVEEVGGNVYFGGTGSSVWSALQRGMKVGFVGGTDSHRAQPGEPRSPLGGLDPDDVVVGGLTAVLARDLTREAIWEALRARRCYATQGQRTLVGFALAQYPLGSVLTPERCRPFAAQRALSYWVVGHRPVTRIELVRSDGELFDLTPKPPPGREPVAGVFNDDSALRDIEPAMDAVFYYLRVTEADGRMAWSSPIWLQRE
jgi:hypothetical protein